MAPANRLAAAALWLLLLSVSTHAGGAGDPDLFGDRLTSERGERLRLASELDREGWPALQSIAVKALDAERLDPSAAAALVKLDDRITALGERLRPRLRQAPLDALDSLARADLAMLRAAEAEGAQYCSYYLWPNSIDRPALGRAARSAGRSAQLALLRTIKAAETLRAENPTYYAERISDEQAELRARGLTTAEIAFAAAGSRPPGVDDAAGCRATVRYLEAVLDYPARLRSATLAWRLSGEYGEGDD